MLKISVRHTGRGAAVWSDIDKRLDFGIHQGMQASVSEAKVVMLAFTSGTISTQQLKNLNHPFGRGQAPNKKPRGLVVPLLPINVQNPGGGLQSTFFANPNFAGGNVTYQLGFSAFYAQFVLRPRGTRLMVARGYFPAVTPPISSAFKRNMKAALASALS